MSRRAKPRGKRIKPQIWVFCEGQTEEAYVAHLRSRYRIPIEIVTKVAGTEISEVYIKRQKKGKPVHTKDRDFLMYDSDVPAVLTRLAAIPNVTLLLSNPAIELWFLLHYKNQTAAISSDDCIRQLSNRNRNTYIKGRIDNKLERHLNNGYMQACVRAKSLRNTNNPSSNVYIFIETLASIKSQS